MSALVEITNDAFGEYETRWECEPPTDDTPYVVECQTWDDDCTIRTIHRISIP